MALHGRHALCSLVCRISRREVRLSSEAAVCGLHAARLQRGSSPGRCSHRALRRLRHHGRSDRRHGVFPPQSHFGSCEAGSASNESRVEGQDRENTTCRTRTLEPPLWPAKDARLRHVERSGGHSATRARTGRLYGRQRPRFRAVPVLHGGSVQGVPFGGVLRRSTASRWEPLRSLARRPAPPAWRSSARSMETVLRVFSAMPARTM